MAQEWGSWKNLRAASEGGQGYVFEVIHETTGARGAFKILKNEKRLDRFQNEIDAVKTLNHPHIASLIDADLNAKKPYAVYEWVAGGAVSDISSDELETIPLEQRLSWCEQVCDAISHAHGQGIIHRDIKPANVLLDADRKTVRLCDFGLVHFINGDRVTATEEQVGSRYFIPPECEEGRVEDVSAATDLYSTGKLIYFLVSGGHIFSRERHREPSRELTSILDNPFAEQISVLLDRLITPSPSTRIQTASEVLDALSRAKEGVLMNAPCKGKPGTHLCVFCKVGYYQVVAVSQDSSTTHNLGYREGRMSGEDFVYVECTNCGNCQKFKFKHGAGHWFATEDPETPGDPRVRSSRVHVRPDGSS